MAEGMGKQESMMMVLSLILMMSENKSKEEIERLIEDQKTCVNCGKWQGKYTRDCDGSGLDCWIPKGSIGVQDVVCERSGV